MPWAVVVGTREAEAGVVKLKDLRTGEQVALDLADAVARVAAG